MNRENKQVFAETSAPIRFIDPDQVGLQCFDAKSDEFVSCARGALDLKHPFVRVIVGDSILPMAIDRTEHVIDVELGAQSAPDRLSLEEVLGVRPLPSGPYDVELRLRSTSFTRPIPVRRRVLVGALGNGGATP